VKICLKSKKEEEKKTQKDWRYKSSGRGLA
jgi:hypothetical protein